MSVLNLKQKPNLSNGVSIKKVSNEAKRFTNGIKPRMPIKTQLKSVKDPNSNRAGFTDDIYNIWGARKNISTFEKNNNKSMKSLWLFIFILICVLVVSYLGWNFFNNFKPLSGTGVAVEIFGDNSVISGDRLRLTIKYQNKEQVKVKNVELRLNYPEGMYYISSSKDPDNLGVNLWKLGDLDPNEDGKINLEIQVIGNLNDNLNLGATIAYEPVNFSSIFESKLDYNIEIEKINFELNIESPSELGNNNRIEYKIIYKNISNDKLSDARIRFEYPIAFVLSEINAASLEQSAENIWNLGQLEKDASGEISVMGFLDTTSNTSSTFNAVIEIKSLYGLENISGQNAVSEWIPYVKISKDTTIIPSDVPLKIIINNNPIDSALSWGDELKYEISYKNNSENPITNVAISVKLDSKYLDINTLNDVFGGDFDEDNLVLTWDKNSVPSLAKLEKGQEGKFNFSIKLNKFDNKYIGSDDYLVKSEAKLTYEDSLSKDKESTSNFIINKINSPIEISAKARYYDNSNAVGSGPLPPVVGETTTYEIVWQLKSLISDLNDITIKTILPPNVDWGEGNTNGSGNIVYNSQTREIVWQIDKLYKGNDYIVQFNVLLTPDKSQKDKIVTLINQTNLSGIDSSSDSKINKDIPYLTSELLGDKKASGKGKVIDL
ncbi:MAG: hypothetical protein PHH83_01780 [Patescibacteria group bacterium]|nr:hypothetical protein [Patescibacteria group bacterium]